MSYQCYVIIIEINVFYFRGSIKLCYFPKQPILIIVLEIVQTFAELKRELIFLKTLEKLPVLKPFIELCLKMFFFNILFWSDVLIFSIHLSNHDKKVLSGLFDLYF